MMKRKRGNLEGSVRKFRFRCIFLCITFIVCVCYIIIHLKNLKKSEEHVDEKPIHHPVLWKKSALYKNTTVATTLYNEVRILCLVLIKKDYKSYEHIESTWGRRCNKLILLERKMYRKSDDSADFTEFIGKYGDVWSDVKASFQYIYDNHLNDADWFLKTNDETYVIMENLRYYLYTYRSEEPLYFMYEPFEPQDRLSIESAYVLSKEALKSFVELALQIGDTCQVQQFVYESNQIASCLDSAGVNAIDTRNAQGISAFLPHYLHTLDVIKNYKSNWRNIRQRLVEVCCPEYPIFYQQLSTNEMHLLDFAIYRLQIYGTFMRLEDLRP